MSVLFNIFIKWSGREYRKITSNICYLKCYEIDRELNNWGEQVICTDWSGMSIGRSIEIFFNTAKYVAMHLGTIDVGHLCEIGNYTLEHSPSEKDF